MRLARASLIAVTLFTGCVQSYGVAVGPPQPPRSPDCAVEVAQTAPEELLPRYRRVGSVCVASQLAAPNEILRSNSARRELMREACALGGDLVTPSGTCNADRVGGTEFAVMRAR